MDTGASKNTEKWSSWQIGQGRDYRVPSDQIVGTSFAVGKQVIWSHLKKEYLCRWKACKVFRQSKTLMSEPLASRTKYLQAISRSKLKVTVGLLTCHTTLRDRIFKLGLTQRQDCQLCGDEKEDSVHIGYHCPTLVCKILCIIVRHWYIKYTKHWVVCSWSPMI